MRAGCSSWREARRRTENRPFEGFVQDRKAGVRAGRRRRQGYKSLRPRVGHDVTRMRGRRGEPAPADRIPTKPCRMDVRSRR